MPTSPKRTTTKRPDDVCPWCHSPGIEDPPHGAFTWYRCSQECGIMWTAPAR